MSYPTSGSDVPTLSLILCSRNDEYMGNSLWRLRTALDYAARQVAMLGKSAEVEILVTDWGSVTPLREVVELSPEAAAIVSFLHVPMSIATSLQRDSPFAEVIALNAAARRARGRYIGRIDQDTLVSETFFRVFFEMAEGRRNPGFELDSAVLFSNQRMIPYRFAVRALPLADVERFIERFGSSARIESGTGRPFHDYGVGIFLMHRDIWHSCGGYDESMIYMNSMEIDMIARLKRRYQIVNLGELVDFRLYHLEHYHPWVPRRSSTYRRSQRPPLHPEFSPNDQDWGLSSIDIAIQTARQARGTFEMRGRASGIERFRSCFGDLVVSFQIDADRIVDRARLLARFVRRVPAGLRRRASTSIRRSGRAAK